MILLVTFEHSYTVLNYFSKSAWGSLSTAGFVIWLDLMMFFSLLLIENRGNNLRFWFGWFIFIIIVLISGLLNIYYMWRNSPDEFTAIMSQVLSISVGGVAPLGIVFLGMVNATADHHIIAAQVHRIKESERDERKAEPQAPRPQVSSKKQTKQERNQLIFDLKAQGVNNSEIGRRIGISRRTVITVLKGHN